MEHSLHPTFCFISSEVNQHKIFQRKLRSRCFTLSMRPTKYIRSICLFICLFVRNGLLYSNRKKPSVLKHTRILFCPNLYVYPRQAHIFSNASLYLSVAIQNHKLTIWSSTADKQGRILCTKKSYNKKKFKTTVKLCRLPPCVNMDHLLVAMVRVLLLNTLLKR